MLRYAVTIFLSAFLLFQVQPLIGKFILPWFGGSPAVWTTCMLFFQVVLLAGYSYAHLIASRLTPRMQTVCHLALLAASLWFMNIDDNAQAWKPSGGEVPVERILALLTATIGLPYFLLSSTGPLLQECFRRETGRTPYRLYSLSNIGSLLALLSYPFLFEPQLTLHIQIKGWSWGYGLFVACSAWCAVAFARATQSSSAITAAEPSAIAVPAARPSARDIAMWLSLAACGSVMLLATTNQLCQEVPAVPFLWVLPLALYLFTFIICFDHERWYHRGTFLVLLGAAVLLAGLAITMSHRMGMWWQLATYSATLFVCCMVCHGELVNIKPAPQYATLFYLMVSAGGAFGGILVALVAPLVLHDFYEYPIGLLATVVLAILAVALNTTVQSALSRRIWIAGGIICAVVGSTIGVALGVASNINPEETNLETTRNFYGVLRVNLEENEDDENGPKREMIHGRIQHGFQYQDEFRRLWPTTYYGHLSGVGLAIDHHPRRGAEKREDRTLRIGVIGLGCGTLAAYGEAGDSLRFYEINPEVIRLSDKYFTYRKDTPAKVEVVLGDARINMERELAKGEEQQFDVLAVDAFSSDSIPMHLLTRQCVELYRQHLKADGLLCLHLSNRYLTLEPVALGIAEAVGCECILIDDTLDNSRGVDYSTWAILTDNSEFLEKPEIMAAASPWKGRPPIVWTDDYASLWQVLAQQRDLTSMIESITSMFKPASSD